MYSEKHSGKGASLSGLLLIFIKEEKSMSKKKISAIVLVVCLSLIMAVGCGNDDTEKTKKNHCKAENRNLY